MEDRCKSPSFDEFAEFVREWAGISRKKKICVESKFEDDLGITGDDGCELLEETEKRFGIRLSSDDDGYRKTFQLEPGEFLFHGEGFSINVFEFIPLFRSPVAKVKAFTVGELHSAVLTALASRSRQEQ
jgi:acyl carrier protein